MNKVFRVVNKYEQKDCINIPNRNIFLSKGEAQLFKVNFELEHPSIDLIILESEVQWKQSGS